MAFIFAVFLILTIFMVVFTPLLIGGVAALLVAGFKGKAKAREIGIRVGLITLLIVAAFLGSGWLIGGIFVGFVNLF